MRHVWMDNQSAYCGACSGSGKHQSPTVSVCDGYRRLSDPVPASDGTPLAHDYPDVHANGANLPSCAEAAERVSVANWGRPVGVEGGTDS